MTVADFLFEGTPPPSTTEYGSTVESMPRWLSDYTQGLIARANAIASEPYAPYAGPRIAGFNEDQNAAFGATREMQGAWRPGMDTAADMVSGGVDTVGSMVGAGTQSFPGASGAYMDPYISNVLMRQQELSNRNLTENFLPALQDSFTKSGQFGSTKMMETGMRGVRDISENLQSQQMGALSEGYRQAGEMFNADQNRMLAGAEIYGDTAMTGATNLSGMAESAQNMGLRDAAAMQTIGGQQQEQSQQNLDLAYQDFLAQRDHPRQNVDWLSATIRGMPYNTTTTTQQTGPASSYGPSGASQLGALVTTGMGVYDQFKDGGRNAQQIKGQYKEGGVVRGATAMAGV